VAIAGLWRNRSAMAEVRVTESHSLQPADAIGKIQSFEEMLKKYGVKANWKGNSAKLKGTGVSGSIDVTGRDVTVVVKLGMLARAAGVKPDKLENSIRKRLRAAFDET